MTDEVTQTSPTSLKVGPQHGSKHLLAVLGPTGSGKSRLAVRLARTLGGEVVNFDSVQVHRGLDIGSAKTPVCEREGIQHHLLDVVGPAEELTAGSYAHLGRLTIEGIAARGRLPILVGGTGFYLKALLEGLPPAGPRNPELRACLAAAEGRRPGLLHRYLRRRDPVRAASIHQNDRQKLIRAIELRTGDEPERPRQALTEFTWLKLGLNPERGALYARINQRCQEMFERGLIDETAQLLAEGVSSSVKSLQSLGYKQAIKLLKGKLTNDEAVAECQLRTRQYAKRQITWFRREEGVIWLAGFGFDPRIEQAALLHVATKWNNSANE